jgi:hypothetical protein
VADAKKETVAVDEAAELRAQLAALSAQVTALTKTQTQSGGITADQLEAVMSKLIAVQADAQNAALREIAERDQRDDVNYPRVSVYSYPEGDRARPRPQFKCRMFWVGFDMDWDTTTAEEIELLNLCEPGEYTFRRIGGGLEKLHVTGERNPSGKLTKLDFMFASKEQRDTLPPMAWMLRDALGVKTAEQAEIERLKAEVNKLRTAQAVA